MSNVAKGRIAALSPLAVANASVHVSETGVFPSLDRVSGTLCLLHYVTETSHLYSLRDF